MKKLLSIIMFTLLLSSISFAQKMNIHTSNGTDAYNLADIDSITFTIPQDTLTTGTVTDIDGNVYQTVKVDGQWWMAENLKVTHFRNGDIIPNITNASEWDGLSSSAYCLYNNEENNKETYGLLYNWYAAKDERNIAPEGWHAATDEDWKQMEMFLGMTQADADKVGFDRGTDEGGKLKEIGTMHWLSPNTGATNEVGFTALPAGYRYHAPGTDFEWVFEVTYFWSNSSDTYARYRTLYHDNSTIYRGEYSSSNKPDGMSIRCVKD